MEPRISYLVVGVERSGTTLLCEGLERTKIAGKPREFFVGWWERVNWDEPWSAESYPRFLDMVLQRGTTPNGVFGSKLLWNHFHSNFEKKLRALPGKEALSNPELLASVLPNLQYIFMRRDDHLRQAISWSRAFQTDHWRADHVKSRGPARVPDFDFESIKKLKSTIGRQEDDWHRFFEEAGIQPLEVEYEDLSANPDDAVRRTLDFLGIEPPQEFTFVPRLQKQADELTEEWVDLYEALEGGVPIVYSTE